MNAFPNIVTVICSKFHISVYVKTLMDILDLFRLCYCRRHTFIDYKKSSSLKRWQTANQSTYGATGNICDYIKEIISSYRVSFRILFYFHFMLAVLYHNMRKCIFAIMK